MKFAKWVFIVAGVYGILVTAPIFFSEKQFAVQFPPAINHPEYFYGFAAVTLAWQIAFLVIASNPLQNRTLMLVAVAEKIPYAISIAVLFAQGRVSNMFLGFGVIDFILGILFFVSYLLTKK